MKYRIFSLMLTMGLVISLFAGCSTHSPATAEDTMSAAEKASSSALPEAPIPDSTREINEESVRIYSIDPNAPIEEIPDETVPLAPAPTDGSLTKRDAEAIALQHAGFDFNQISFLYTKYDPDDGIDQYEVNFREGDYEYEIMVHAETGEILEFDKDHIHD